ncbi:molybdopterin oxidoreductase [Cellulomonas fimi]|uniref:Molybdopterin oxidoreductase n=1 Tax=Cellulomonas fimi TaxID=1708 RepID=A0A7Y0LX87_CELFI|nr:molybdopterin oxidoreductase [Cellulomonas fimi]NMR19931.1 molybdopterin oxidoreductase [Cellulomonas fimi]
MTTQTTRHHQRRAHSPAWWTVAAWSSLGLLVLGGLAGALGMG